MSWANYDLLNRGRDSVREVGNSAYNLPLPRNHTFLTEETLAQNGSNGVTIIDLIDVFVNSTPEREAVLYGNHSLTFKELDILSNRLGHHLRSKGVKEDTMVPICMDRSLEMIVGILAVIKAGAAYVPIDSQLPQSQIQRILHETDANLVLTHQNTSSKIEDISRVIEVIEWETIKPLISSLPDSRPTTDLSPCSLAYIIFTSGSTGEPKGVLVEHAQLYNATQARCTYYKSFSNILLVPSFSFDASLAAIFGSLCSGGCLFICSQEDLQSPQQLERLIPQLDTLLCVPSYYQFLLTEGLLQHARLSKVILGGEAISRSLVLSHFEKNSNAKLFNEYGPTETAIWATVDQIESVDSLITIGLPIEGADAYVLDPKGNLLEENAVGELHIGGKGVARGYLNDAQKTASQFISNPIDASASRLYKTGDLCYKLPDKRIVFVGRADNQVKINGYRIEMGGIESALQQIDGVQQAAVVAKDFPHGLKHLLAFVQLHGTLDKKSLRTQLQAHLPDYMIPNVWVQVDDFPLTPNGKIDRQALQKQENNEVPNADLITATGAVETFLLRLWQSYLPIQPMSVDDDFFELGGNSIMAMSLAASIRRELKLDISISAFFQRPTIAGLAQWIKSVSDSATEYAAIAPKTDERLGDAPLSYGQESLWLIDQVGESVAYHLPIALRIEGYLDIEALTWSIRNLLQRHEALRTTIRSNEDEKYQHLLSVEDWKSNQLKDGSNPDSLEELLKQPFDLSRDFMLRAWLIQSAQKENILFLVIHHIAFDAWSKRILLEELWSGYNAYVNNLPFSLPPLAVNYVEYALWQRSEAEKTKHAQQLEYWKNKLQDLSPLQLPRDLFSYHQTVDGAVKAFTIPHNLLTEIERLSKKQGATLFMTLLAGFKVLLHRYSSQDDILIGTAIAGREQPGTEALIGYFVNSLPLRTEIKGDATFLDILDKVKQTALEAYDAKEVPFEKIVAETGAQRQAGRNPLFQVMFNFQNVPAPNPMVNDDLALSSLDIRQTASKFDLTFSLSKADEILVGEVEFRTGKYLPSTIDRMIQHYLLLLEAAIQQPSERVGKLNMIGNEEQQLLHAFNQTTKFYAEEKTVLDLLEKQAQETPDKIAVIFGHQQVSYKTLDERSNQLAHLLREKGARKETLVLLCMSRSLEMVIALLGILKSGAAYVPIDPAYPQQRKNFIQEDTAAQLAVTDPENLKELSTLGCEIITLEAGASNLSYLSPHKVETTVQPEHLAYIIYTSGSTGRPKGVMIEHRNVYSFISWCREEFSSSPCKVVYAATSICFDLSVFEIFYSLSTGIPIRLLQDGLEIKLFLPKDDHIMINTVPSVVEHLLDEEVDLSNVSVLNMAGEPLTKKILEGLDVDSIQVRNLYGPTEDTTYSTFYRIGNEREILIGRPISNTSVYIINQENTLNAIGVPGEICLSGCGLARGYFNRPDLTEERFVLNPFTPTSGDRMYKTGDMGRWLPNGQIEYIGRKDDQVKIRGYRIELGEIERVLQQFPAIRQAVVLAKKDQKGSPHLVGYLIMKGSFDKRSIADFLKQRLPLYMVPSLWVELKAFPLTPNGKIDKKKLPDPLLDGLMAPLFVAPRTEVEKNLSGIWKELLQTKRVGLHDDFFALGGNSLFATRFIAAVQETFDVKLRIVDLFAHPTIAGLTANFDFQEKDTCTPVIQSHDPRPDLLPLSYNQESLWFIDQLNGSQHYHIPLVLKLDGVLDFQALDLSLRGIVDRHEVLRTVIRHNDGLPHQVVKDSLDWKVQRIDGQSLQNDPAEVRKIIGQIIEQPFDLSDDFMLRAFLIQLDQKCHVLTIVIHHIAFDGWSIPLLLNELAVSYQAFQGAGKPNLAPLPLQYSDYAIWQKQYLQGDFLKQKARYWKEKLHNVSMLQLPVDYPKPSLPNYKGSVETIYIDQTLREQLWELGHEQSATLFMTLLTTFKMLLSHYSGQQDICVGTVATGRQQKELEKLIGYFVHTLPIRSNLSPQARFLDLLQGVRTNTLEAFENQELPFEKMVAETQAQRNLNENPLFQVLFLFQSIPEPTSLPLGELTMALQAVDQRTSKFDLSFIISEAPSGLRLEIEYNINLFKQTTIKQIASDYIRLLQLVVLDPQKNLLQYLQEGLAQTEPFERSVPNNPDPNGQTVRPLQNEEQTAEGDSEKIVAKIWCRALGRTAIGINDNFFEIGGQSLVAVQVMSQLEKELGKKLPLSVLFKHPTIKEMAQAIEREAEKTKVWRSLVPIKTTGNKHPLYIVHGGGANILPFYSIAKNMDPNQPVYGLQPKGLDGKEKPLRSVEAIASHFIGEILQHNPDGPINLAGYSFGGIIAFEMAQQLKVMGKEVEHLVMFDTIAYQSDHNKSGNVKLKDRINRSLGKRRFDLFLATKHPRAFWKVKKDSIRQKLRRLGIWLGVEKTQPLTELMKVIESIEDSHREASENYVLEPYDGAIHLMKAKTPTSYHGKGIFLGWDEYVKHIYIEEMEGEHTTMFSPPHDIRFARSLQKILDE